MNYVLQVYLPGLVLGLYFLIQSFKGGYWPFVLLGWVLISGLGVAVGFHRVFSHKTHRPKKWLDFLLLVLGSLGGQGSSISWVAVHRGYHHRFSDTEKDLHSPTHGYLSAALGWYWRLTPETINHKYAVELLRLKTHVFVHKHYIRLLHIWVAALLVLSVWSGLPLVDIYLATLFISLVQDNAVNTLCHSPSLGYRNFSLKDNSNNFWILGYLGWGQGFHENHHAFPAKYNFGYRWWEFDPSVIFLPLLWLGSTDDVTVRKS